MKEAFFEAMNGIYYKLTVPDKILVSEKSKFQNIDIIELNNGKALILDNFIQFWTGDEFIYHEMLSHLPMLYHSSPERVLVLGAGDGFLLRELLKYKSVKEIVLVDIDEKVVHLCKEYFADENRNSLDDPRVKVIIDDALHYADVTNERFDVVIMDLIAYEAGAELYTQDTVRKFMKLLKEDGIFATHGDDSSDSNHVGLKLFSKVSALFKYSKVALAYVPSFDSLWTFMVMSHHEIVPKNNERVETKYFQPEKEKFYTSLPPYLQEELDKYRKEGFEKFVNTKYNNRRIKLSERIEDLI